MSDPLNEQLSAFIDGELPRAEGDLFVRHVPRDAELRSMASRYYLIGQAIRAEHSSVRSGFAARVLAVVAREVPQTGVAGSVTALARDLPRSRWFGLWKPAAGLAIAASVAMLAILVLQNQRGTHDNLPLLAKATTPAPATTAAQARVATVKPELTAFGSNEPKSYVVPPAGDGTNAPLAAARLASYVFAHSEYSSLPGRRNVVSDAAVQQIGADAPAEATKP
jgi:sigma-E factor negative regulatory protein RseA